LGTRGLIGFVIDGVEKLSYNHWDSYPSGLGLTMLQFARDCMAEADDFGRTHHVKPEVLDKVRALTLVDESDKPTEEQQKLLAEHANTTVSSGSTEEWYVLLRELQGDPGGVLEAGFMIDSHEFVADSLFNEGTYLIDFDEGVFEAYTGFVKEPHDEGRFADVEPAKNHAGVVEYYPIRLVGRWPLTELPTDQEFVTQCERED
jgi:hypothetical protein